MTWDASQIADGQDVDPIELEYLAVVVPFPGEGNISSFLGQCGYFKGFEALARLKSTIRMSVIAPGVRVARGPDWAWENEDGSELKGAADENGTGRFYCSYLHSMVIKKLNVRLQT